MEILPDPEACVTLQQLAILSGTAFDKGQLASGGVTSRTVSEPETSHDELLAHLDELRAQEANTIDDEPLDMDEPAGAQVDPDAVALVGPWAMDLAVTNCRTNGAPLLLPAHTDAGAQVAQAAGVPAGAQGACTDLLSDANHHEI